MQDNQVMWISLLQVLLIAAVDVCGEPHGFDSNNRNLEEQLENEDNYSVVDNIAPLQPGQSKQLRIMKYPADYTDYEYYINSRRSLIDKDLNGGTSVNKMSYGESNVAPLNRPAEVSSLPWYGQFRQFSKPISSIPMYPSRSYDPYIRRYDRFDEQYHRSYPQYFEDMYMHRQRFDPYDSYSPRVPQYPDPYVMYPDRYLDTPTSRDYIKSRRAYIDDPMGLPADSFNINSKYNPSKLPELTYPVRNERVVYYAHLPEIVRTPYDGARSEERNSAALVMSPSTSSSSASLLSSSSTSTSPYKLNKKKIKSISRPLVNNSTNYKMSL